MDTTIGERIVARPSVHGIMHIVVHDLQGEKVCMVLHEAPSTHPKWGGGLLLLAMFGCRMEHL